MEKLKTLLSEHGPAIYWTLIALAIISGMIGSQIQQQAEIKREVPIAKKQANKFLRNNNFSNAELTDLSVTQSDNKHTHVSGIFYIFSVADVDSNTTHDYKVNNISYRFNGKELSLKKHGPDNEFIKTKTSGEIRYLPNGSRPKLSVSTTKKIIDGNIVLKRHVIILVTKDYHFGTSFTW